MTTWRHANETPIQRACQLCFLSSDERGINPCTTPTPDPTSPCGYPLELASGERHCPWLRSAHPGEPSEYDLPLTRHPYRPTRCTCGHPIEEATR